MGSRPANFQLAMPFRSRLSVGHGIDRQTDKGTHCIMPPHYGAGHNKSISDSEIIVNGVAVERNGNMSRVIHQNMQLICCIVICLVLSLIYSHFPTDVSFPLSRVTK